MKDGEPDEVPREGGPPSTTLDEALAEHARLVRRRLLRGAGAGAVLLALGGGGVFLYLRQKKGSDKALAASRAAAAEKALLAGEIARAKKLAREARDLDRQGHEAAIAYLRVGAFDLIDGDGDANASVALLHEARNLGAGGATLALVSVAAAIGIKNDRVADKILREPRDADVASDGFYAFAAGAALDLGCAPGSTDWYDLAIELLPDPFLAEVRRARALILAGDVKAAGTSIDRLPQDRIEWTVLTALATRVPTLDGGEPKFGPQIDRAKIGELPRSLRALATALALQDPDQPWGQSAGLDAALDDIDTPLVAVLAGRIALAGGDRVSARAAADAALRMREELDQAKLFSARMSLVEGDLAGATKLAGQGPDAAMIATLHAIDAYEAADSKRLADVEKDAGTGPYRWALYSAAQALLEGKSADVAGLQQAAARGEPWGDFVAFDAAMQKKDTETAKKIAAGWTGSTLTAAQKARKQKL